MCVCMCFSIWHCRFGMWVTTIQLISCLTHHVSYVLCMFRWHCACAIESIELQKGNHQTAKEFNEYHLLSAGLFFSFSQSHFLKLFCFFPSSKCFVFDFVFVFVFGCCVRFFRAQCSTLLPKCQHLGHLIHRKKNWKEMNTESIVANPLLSN